MSKRVKTSNWIPTDKQKEIAEALTNIEDTRTVQQIITDAKICNSTYYNWRNDPNFSSYLAMLSNKAFRTAEPDINRSFINQAKNGSFQHQKLYYEMVDRYQAKVQINVVDDQIKAMSNEELAMIANMPDDGEE